MKLDINNHNEDENDKKSKRLLYIFWLFLFVLIIICIIVFWVSGRIGKIGKPPKTHTQAVVGEIQITEDSVEWNKMDNLNIFNNKYFNSSKIAPGIAGEYLFKINNATNRKISYDISMYEDNIYGINMKYKLRLGDKYLVGSEDSWGNASDLKLENIKEKASSVDNYTLEWYWESSENDTEIGKNFDANYRLEINITTNLYEGETIE